MCALVVCGASVFLCHYGDEKKLYGQLPACQCDWNQVALHAAVLFMCFEHAHKQTHTHTQTLICQANIRSGKTVSAQWSDPVKHVRAHTHKQRSARNLWWRPEIEHNMVDLQPSSCSTLHAGRGYL